MKFRFQSLVAMMLMISLIQNIHAEESTHAAAQIFNNADEAYNYVISSGKLLTITGEAAGTSDALVGSAEKAIQEAKSNAKNEYGYVNPVSQHVMKTWFGQAMQYDAKITLFKIIDLTPDNLANQITHLTAGGKYPSYLLNFARQPEYKSLSAKYKEFIRNNNTESSYIALDTLTELIVLHEGKDCGDDLKKWIKYHKNSKVRKASYLALLKMGRTADVEEALQTEPDRFMKQEIQKNLL